MSKKENSELLKRKWSSLSTLKAHLEKDGIEVLYFDGALMKTKRYKYTLISPQLFMEKI